MNKTRQGQCPGDSHVEIELRDSGLGILDVDIEVRGTALKHIRGGNISHKH